MYTNVANVGTAVVVGGLTSKCLSPKQNLFILLSNNNPHTCHYVLCTIFFHFQHHLLTVLDFSQQNVHGAIYY